MKVWACRDPLPKTDYRAALGTLILNLVLEQQISALSPTSACFVKQTNKKNPENVATKQLFPKRGFNEETQDRFIQCWENVHSLIMEAETQPFMQVRSKHLDTWETLWCPVSHSCLVLPDIRKLCSSHGLIYCSRSYGFPNIKRHYLMVQMLETCHCAHLCLAKPS